MTQDNVARIPRHEDAPLVQVPAIGVSIQVDLGAGRVAALQTHVAGDCTLRDLNFALDKMTSAGDRQRAHYQLEELRRDLGKVEKEQSQHQEDLDRLDREHEAAQKKRLADAEAAVKALGDYETAVTEERVARGQRGPVVLKGSPKAHADRIKDGIAKLKVDMAKAVAEHDVAHGNSKATFERRAATITKLKEEVARCEEIVAAGLK